jgi:TRAP-type mannitol/chloroaromatic compound transport system substrate-binding protein
LAFRATSEQTFEKKAASIRNLFFKGGLADLLREEYAKLGLYWLDIHTYGPVPVVLSSKPLNSCDDFKGLKIRSEGINMEWLSKLGMSAVSISGVETYMSLKLGVTDAAEWDISAITGLNWHEVAPYWIRGMENEHCIGHILVNLKKWNKLPDDMKAALQKAAEDY